MKKRICISGLIFLLINFSSVFGQNETDVVRYLSTDFLGTARVASMAGAFGALGGDLTAPLINPAGSGIYRKNDVEFTPGYAFQNTDVHVSNQDFSNQENHFIFSNIGFVYSGEKKANKPTYFNFSIGYFQSKNFTYGTTTNYINDVSSMLFDFTQQAQGISVEELSAQTPFSSSLAWQTYLIDEKDTTVSGSYITQPRYEIYFPGVNQKYNVSEDGSMGDIYLNSAVAIQQKVFIGLTVGITLGNFNQKTTFTETTINDSLLLDYYIFNYEQNTSISGVNAKIGLIYKPEDWLRLGLAYHIPSRLYLKDDWSTSLRSQFKDGDFYSEKSPDGTIEYAIRKPGRLVVSAALIFGFKGLISLDVDWTDYAKSSIISNEFNFDSENQYISQVLQNTFNVRVGGEMWFGKYNIRAGYAYRQNAYANLRGDIPEFFNTFALGAGILTQSNIYVNLSGSYKSGYRKQAAYSPNIAEIENVDEYVIEILASVGYRF
jgi:hypothetical protein